MLYDKRWDKPEVKADPFSLDSLIAWLEKQPADQPYCYENTGKCLHHQYFVAMGVALFGGVGGTRVKLKNGRSVDFSQGFIDTACDEPHTFGAALDRARRAAGY